MRRGDVRVAATDQITAGHCLEQVEMARLRLVETGEQAAHHRRRSLRPEDQGVQPVVACTRPPAAADSRARTTVVPTATTRRPASRVLFTSRAVTAGTVNRSGCGGSCDSWLDTPVSRTIGATGTPRVISRTSARSVSGRPALAISALPGRSAYTFCSDSSGQAPSTYG